MAGADGEDSRGEEEEEGGGHERAVEVPHFVAEGTGGGRRRGGGVGGVGSVGDCADGDAVGEDGWSCRRFGGVDERRGEVHVKVPVAGLVVVHFEVDVCAEVSVREGLGGVVGPDERLEWRRGVDVCSAP